MRLSKNFTLKELTYSATALRLGIENQPSKEGIYKLTLLTAELLQPLRNVVGSIRITSGYRSPQLAEVISPQTGANSQHCRYEAIDCQFVKRGVMSNLTIYNALIELDLDYDQCILEFGSSTEFVDGDPAWIHLSWKVSDNRRQTLVAYKDDNNKTKYRPKIKYNSI
jgi:zinc D-Ala-D-Ala carboxypeptidase